MWRCITTAAKVVKQLVLLDFQTEFPFWETIPSKGDVKQTVPVVTVLGFTLPHPPASKHSCIWNTDRPVRHSGWQWRLGPDLLAGGFRCRPWLWARGRESGWSPAELTASCTGSALPAAGSGSPHRAHTAVPEASGGGTNRCSCYLCQSCPQSTPDNTHKLFSLWHFYWSPLLYPMGINKMYPRYQIASVVFIWFRFSGHY